MINGNPHEFVNRIFSCQDTVYLFRGVKYWFQGYMPDSGKDFVHMEIFQCDPPANPADSVKWIWTYDGMSSYEGMEAFLKAAIFDGKTFWEVEQEIEWTD